MQWYHRRVELLEKTDAKDAAYVNDPEHYQFRIACSCPPSTTLYLRGGLMYNTWTGNSWFVENDIIDLTDEDQMSGSLSIPSVAGSYYVYVLGLNKGNGVAPHTYWLYGSGDEHTGAADAEQDLQTYWFSTRSIWTSYYPLCGLIVRANDTATGILAVDPINRGRSYTWPRDMRPRTIAF